MTLWIRSQDRKRLIECHELGLQERLQGQFAVVIANRHIIGTYKNKQRAIEVLDEIQRHIFTKEGDFIFIMPEE